MSISEEDITMPNVMDFVNPTKYAPIRVQRTQRAREARLTLKNCPSCASRAVEETMIVRRPGQPVARRVLLRCWRNATPDRPKCPIIVVEETPLDEVDDFPYSRYKTEKKKPKKADPPKTIVLDPPKAQPPAVTKPPKEVKRKFCVDCSADITGVNHNAVRCVPCRQEYRRALGRKRYRRDRGPREDRHCDACGKVLRCSPGQNICAHCTKTAKTRSREEAKLASKSLITGRCSSAERRCLDCGQDISHRMKTCVRCIDCADKHYRAMSPIWDKELRARRKLIVNH